MSSPGRRSSYRVDSDPLGTVGVRLAEATPRGATAVTRPPRPIHARLQRLADVAIRPHRDSVREVVHGDDRNGVRIAEMYGAQ